MSKDYNGPGTDELMKEIINLIEGVNSDWDKIKNKHNAAAGRRIRKSLDDIAKIKVNVRKAMLKEGR